ncbi:hypothetical protein QKT49_gp247 [Acanthamoeba castellanii medusavirus]|uniref:Uncharacterized protein n=1 Tax=Acanthamoeba castellanii medusavirus J1 TaxID=3114988 RepID=A0A3T1CXG1_9VIRU|nr:hypothetical protein QKT49_gp247 [Acanthamoeba castellanii medusavirus]BBI30516.1 hypothetical protein [Acanthamoeba castellanii medusavirus J1]
MNDPQHTDIFVDSLLHGYDRYRRDLQHLPQPTLARILRRLQERSLLPILDKASPRGYYPENIPLEDASQWEFEPTVTHTETTSNFHHTGRLTARGIRTVVRCKTIDLAFTVLIDSENVEVEMFTRSMSSRGRSRAFEGISDRLVLIDVLDLLTQLVSKASENR